MQAMNDASDRLSKNPNLIACAVDGMTAAWHRARRAESVAHPFDSNAAVVVDNDFNTTRRKVVGLGFTPAGLVEAEIELARFEAIAAAAEEKAAAEIARQRGMNAGGIAAQMAGRPSLCPTLDAAAPAILQRINAAWLAIGPAAHDNPAAFLEGLDDLDAAILAFKAAIGVERRAARLRASQRAAKIAINHAIAA